jgi:initiation factor 1A
MPGRKQGGINNTRVNKNTRKCPIIRMQIQYAKLGQQYGFVKNALGSCNFNVETLNGDVRRSSPGGTLSKQGRIKAGDWVLIQPQSDNENGQYEIMFKYTNEQYKCLEKEGRLVKIEDPTKKKESTDEPNPGDARIDDGFAFEGEKLATDDGDMAIINEMFNDNIENFIDDI